MGKFTKGVLALTLTAVLAACTPGHQHAESWATSLTSPTPSSTHKRSSSPRPSSTPTPRSASPATCDLKAIANLPTTFVGVTTPSYTFTTGLVATYIEARHELCVGARWQGPSTAHTSLDVQACDLKPTLPASCPSSSVIGNEAAKRSIERSHGLFTTVDFHPKKQCFSASLMIQGGPEAKDEHTIVLRGVLHEDAVTPMPCG